MADDNKPVSRYAQRFVDRKLGELEKRALEGSEYYHEFHEIFTKGVDALAQKAKRPELREYIHAATAKIRNYEGEERQHGGWSYEVELDALRWNGATPDYMKQVDGYGQWVRKSPEERARLVLGHYGEDSRTQNDYPGVQAEKSGVPGPVKWGPEQPTAQDAHEYAEKMLKKHLGFNPPILQPSSQLDIRKSEEMSERLGADVRTKAWKKYAKECASPRSFAAKKYGAGEAVDRETRPPSRSRR